MTFDPTGREEHLMLDAKAIYRYIHAGQGEVTLVAPKSLHAHTYRFESPKNKAQFAPGTIFVYVLHDEHKLYLGILDEELGVRLTRQSTFGEDTEAVKGAKYIVKMALRQDLVDKKAMHLYHSGRCCKCGRKLNSYQANLDGIGKKCLKMYNNSLNKEPWNGN